MLLFGRAYLLLFSNLFYLLSFFSFLFSFFLLLLLYLTKINDFNKGNTKGRDIRKLILNITNETVNQLNSFCGIFFFFLNSIPVNFTMLLHFSFPLTEVDSSVLVLFWFFKFKVCVLKEREKNNHIFSIRLTNILAS